MTRQKHVGWFRIGARTLRAVARVRGFEDALPSGRDWYLCPLCLDVLLTVEELETGELTVEHVPPEALGGRDVVLTCKGCNSQAGSWFDAEASKQQRLQRFHAGHSQHPETCELAVGGITTRVETHRAGEAGILMIGIPGINNPADTELLEQHLRSLTRTQTTDFTFAITPRLRYSPERARVSWIRTAYLAAFALLGWTYILQPALQPIREQLRRPSAVVLPLLSAYSVDIDPGRREIWIIKQPEEHRSLLAIWGQHGIFLPLPNDPRSIEELARDLGAVANEPVHYSFRGDSLPWPTKPMHMLDPAADDPVD